MRFRPASALAVALLLPSLLAAANPAPAARRPNLLIVVVDDQSPFDLKEIGRAHV